MDVRRKRSTKVYDK